MVVIQQIDLDESTCREKVQILMDFQITTKYISRGKHKKYSLRMHNLQKWRLLFDQWMAAAQPTTL